MAFRQGNRYQVSMFPKIIEFLGYVPFECPEDSIGKLRYFKSLKGLFL
jgi:hypothetical protein